MATTTPPTTWADPYRTLVQKGVVQPTNSNNVNLLEQQNYVEPTTGATVSTSPTSNTKINAPPSSVPATPPAKNQGMPTKTSLPQSVVVKTVATQHGQQSSPNISDNLVGYQQAMADYTERKSALSSSAATYKVSLVGRAQGNSFIDFGSSVNPSISIPIQDEVVTFDVTPQLSERGNSILIQISNIRAPNSLNYWMGSPSRTFTLNAKLISRTTQEADENFQRLFRLKGWRMPTYGKIGTAYGPETLLLFAYSQNINGVPVNMTDITVEYNDDVDYIQTSNGTPVPIIQRVNITLLESRPMNLFPSFNYEEFRQGLLPTW